MEVAKPLLPVVLALIAGYFGMRQSVAGLDMKVEHTNDRLEDLKVQIERGTASRWTLDQHNSYANIVSERFAAMKDAMGRDSGDIAMLRQSVAVLDAEIDRLRSPATRRTTMNRPTASVGLLLLAVLVATTAVASPIGDLQDEGRRIAAELREWQGRVDRLAAEIEKQGPPRRRQSRRSKPSPAASSRSRSRPICRRPTPTRFGTSGTSATARRFAPGTAPATSTPHRAPTPSRSTAGLTRPSTSWPGRRTCRSSCRPATSSASLPPRILNMSPTPRARESPAPSTRRPAASRSAA